MKRKKIQHKDYIISIKAVDRALELAKHGKLISTRPTRISRNRKAYSRKDLGNLNLED